MNTTVFPFAAPTSTGLNATPRAVASGDFNNDGQADLATANSNGAVSILLNNGNGTFGAPSAFRVGPAPTGLACGDFNADRKPDLATSNFNATVSILTNYGNGTFAAASTVNGVGALSQSITAADFNNDGKTDLATSNQGLISETNGSFSILLSNGYDPFTVLTVAAVNKYGDIVSADFNRDGKADLAAGGPNGTAVLLGSGNGFFNTAPRVGGGATFLSTGDFNADNIADLVYANQTTGGVRLVLGYGDGTFRREPSTDVLPTATALITGFAPTDADADGLPDLAVIGNGRVYTLLNTFPNQSDFQSGLSGNSLTLSPGSDPGKEFFVSVAAGLIRVVTPTETIQFARSAITRLVLSGVSATFSDDLGGLDLQVDSGAVATFAASQHLGTLTVNGTARLTAGGTKVLKVTGLTIGNTAAAYGKLDLYDNALIYDYTGRSTTPLTSTRANIIAARNGGAWTGNYGLTSTLAKLNTGRHTTLGYMTSAQYQALYGPTATFAGEAIDTTAVLVKYTLYGDANFDKKVDFNDFLRLQSGFGGLGGTFATGDFNYTATTDFNDFLVLQANYNLAI